MLIAALGQYFFGITIFITSMFLVMLVLVQRGRGGGLAGALGGPGGQSAFGTKAGDLFTRITVGVAAVWIFLCAAAVVSLKAKKFTTPVVRADQPSMGDSGLETSLPDATATPNAASSGLDLVPSSDAATEDAAAGNLDAAEITEQPEVDPAQPASSTDAAVEPSSDATPSADDAPAADR